MADIEWDPSGGGGDPGDTPSDPVATDDPSDPPHGTFYCLKSQPLPARYRDTPRPPCSPATLPC